MLVAEQKEASDVNDRPGGSLSPARFFSKALAIKKVTKCEIHARIGYRALRIAHATRRKAQVGLRTSDSGSLHPPLGFEVRLHTQSGTQGPAIVRIVRRPHPPEARTMATIPARTASGRRCQTAASSSTSVGIASASMRVPNRSAWAAVAPSTSPPKTALLRPPSPLPCGRQASRPSTIARIRRRSSSVSEPQFSTTCLRLTGSAPDFAPPLPVNAGFSRVKPGFFESCPRHFLHARRAIDGPGGLSLCSSVRSYREPVSATVFAPMNPLQPEWWRRIRRSSSKSAVLSPTQATKTYTLEQPRSMFRSLPRLMYGLSPCFGGRHFRERPPERSGRIETQSVTH